MESKTVLTEQIDKHYSVYSTTMKNKFVLQFAAYC